MLKSAKEYIHPGLVAKHLLYYDFAGLPVFLVNMPVREEAQPNNPPLGPALLAARLHAQNANVQIIDLNGYRIVDKESKMRNLPNGRFLSEAEAANLLEQYCIKHGEPALIGMSGLITTLDWQSKFAAIARKLCSDAIIISGGGLATEFRENLLLWIPELDGICHSEGDDAILKIAYDAKLIRDKGVFNAMSMGRLATYLLRVENGRPKFAYDGGRPKDLDNLPFAAIDSLPCNVLSRYISTPVWGNNAKNSSAAPFVSNRSLSIISSRGCPFSCKFCYRKSQGERNYGVRSAENIATEMERLWKVYDLDFVGIVDDNFMVNADRIKNFADIMEFKGIAWGTHGRLDEAAELRPGGKINDVLRVEEMARAGCKYIGFGAESASPRVLKSMGKGGLILRNGTKNIAGYDFPVTMMEGIKRTFRAGIHANCTWIMGFPGETLQDLKQSVAFMQWQENLYTGAELPGTKAFQRAYNSVNRNMFCATAYPGTEMFKMPVVQDKLHRAFNISFDHHGNYVADENMRYYVRQLDDAGKVIEENELLNYSEMDNNTFLQAREYIENNRIHKILDM